MYKLVKVFMALIVVMTVHSQDDFFDFAGSLADENGVPVFGELTQTMTLDLFSSQTGGVSAYSQTFQNVSVENGNFLLKVGPNLPDLSQVRFVQISLVGNPTSILPRVELLTSGLALNAQRFDGMTSSELLELAAEASQAASSLDTDALNGVSIGLTEASSASFTQVSIQELDAISIQGLIETTNQPLISSLGPLTSLSVTGQITAASLHLTSGTTLVGSNAQFSFLEATAGVLDGVAIGMIDPRQGNFTQVNAGTGRFDIVDVTNPSLTRLNLGLGTMSTQNSGFVNISGGVIQNVILSDVNFASKQSVQLATSISAICSSAHEGLLRYHPDKKAVEFCDGEYFQRLKDVPRANFVIFGYDPTGLKVDAAGNYYVGAVGAGFSPFKKYSHSSGLLLIKYDSTFRTQWGTAVGEIDSAFPPFPYVSFSDFEIVNEEVVGVSTINGSSSPDISVSYGFFDLWITRFDSQGQLLWETTIGTIGAEYGGYLEITDGQEIIISAAGQETSTTTPDIGFKLFKLSSQGSLLWSTTVGLPGSNEEPKTLLGLSDGSFISSGENQSGGFVVKFESDGSTAWSTPVSSFQFSSAIELQDGNTMHGAKSTLDNNIHLIVLDSSGQTVGITSFGGLGSDKVLALTNSPDGGFFVAGETTSIEFFPSLSGKVQADNGNGTDCFIAKMDSNLNILWKRSLGGSSADKCTQVNYLGNQRISLLLSSYSNDFDLNDVSSTGSSYVFYLDSETGRDW